jgi:tyrosyl-tRNA synthetase
MPTVTLPRARFAAGYVVVDLFTDAGLVPSKSEARRLVQQGGAFVGGAEAAGGFTAITDLAAKIDVAALDSAGELVLRAGKKRFCRVITE